MDNPNHIYKDSQDEPLEECKTLMDYILELQSDVGELRGYVECVNISESLKKLENIEDNIKEMARGDWKIYVI